MIHRDTGWQKRADAARRYRMKIAPDGTRLANPDAIFIYERKGDVLRIKTKGMTNHELQDIVVGMCLHFNAEDRKQSVLEIAAYLLDPEEVPSPISRAIAEAWE